MDQVQVAVPRVAAPRAPLVRPDIDRLASRSEWPEDRYFPPCPLVFADGWEPPTRRGASVGEREAGQEEGAPSPEEVSRRCSTPAR